MVQCAKGAVTAQQKKDIESDLGKMDVVEKVIYESSDQAYKHYQEEFGDSPPMAGNITPDQMPESFRVKLKDPPTKYKVVATAFAGRDGVQSVQDQRSILDNLFGLMNGMNVAALFVMALMLIIALMLIVNTVRVSAFSRRRETGSCGSSAPPASTSRRRSSWRPPSPVSSVVCSPASCCWPGATS